MKKRQRTMDSAELRAKRETEAIADAYNFILRPKVGVMLATELLLRFAAEQK